MNKLVIEDPDPSLIERLEALAEANNQSVSRQAEQLLRSAITSARPSRQQIARAVAALTPLGQQASAENLLREDRDR